MTWSASRELEYGRSPSDIRIFLSSQISDDSLKQDRAAAAEALRMLRIPSPWMWEEDATASPRAPEEVYIETARASDGLILIVGATLTAATRAEFEAAVANGVPCFVFLKDVPRDPQAVEFLASIRETHIYKKYRSPDELKTHVLDAIRQHLVWSWRAAIGMAEESDFFTPPALMKRSLSGSFKTLGLGRKTDSSPDIEELRKAILPGLESQSASEAAAVASAILDQATLVESDAIILFVLHELIPLVRESELNEPERGWLANSKGLGFMVLGDYETAVQEFTNAQDVARSQSDPDLMGVALQNVSLLELRRGDATRAEELARQSIDALGETDNDRRMAGVKLNLASILDERGHIDAALELLDDVEDLARSQRDWPLLAYVNGALGIAHARIGQFDRAESLLQRSLRSGKRREDPKTELLARQNLGTLHLHRGRYRRAIRWFSSALGLARQLGARSMEATVHRAMADAYQRDGKIDRSKSHIVLAMAAIELTEDQRAIGRIANDVGVLQLQFEDFGAAELAFREALAAFVRSSDREGQSQALQNLSIVRFEKGAIGEALQSLDQALVLTPHISAQADIWEQKAQMALRSSASRNQAGESFRQMLALRATYLAPDECAWAYGQVAHHLSRAGLTSEAIEFFEQGARIARESGQLETEFHLMNDKGVALADSGNADLARDVFELCLDSEISSTSRPLAQQALYNLGEALRRTGDLASALQPSKEAVELARDLEDPRSLAQSLCNLGTLYVDLEELDVAFEAFEEALVTAMADGDQESEARALSGIGNVAYLRDQFAEAHEYYRRSADIHREFRKDDDYIASLGAATEAWALHARRDDVQEHFQYLIDEAQKKDQEELASETFARIGRRYLEAGNPDEAVESFAISVIAGAVSTRRADEPEAFLEGFLKSVALVTTHLLLSPRKDVRELIKSIESELAGTYQLPADVLSEAFHTSLQTMSGTVGDQS